MANLTQTAIFSKKALRWSLIGVAALAVLLLIVFFGKSIKNRISPAAPLPATVAFGKLPPFDLAQGYKPASGISFQLQTISGELPSLAAYAKVFVIGESEASFGALGNAKARAARVGFEGEPQIVSESVARFIGAKDSSRVLTVEINSGNFTLESNYLNSPEILGSRAQSEAAAIEQAIGFFTSFGVNLSDFPKNKIKTRKLKIDSAKLTEAESIADTNLVEVNMVRDDLDKLPVLPARGDQAPIWALVSAKGIVAAKVNPMHVEKFKFATYPLKGTIVAFEELKARGTTLNQDVAGGEIEIINVALGYIESDKSGQYLQPVYVFRGLGDLVAYVGAVDDAWIQNSLGGN